MTVLKLTKSGKGFQIIDDDGRVYMTSVNSIHFLLGGKAKNGFITTKRLPFGVAKDRFAPSELYDPDGVFEGNAAKTLELTTTNDGLSTKSVNNKEDGKIFEDKDVW